LGLDFSLAENAALRLGDILRLCGAGTELDGDVTVTVRSLLADNLETFQAQNGDRHVPAIILEQAGHPQLLRDHASAHDPCSYTEAPSGGFPRVRASAQKCDASPRL